MFVAGRVLTAVVTFISASRPLTRPLVDALAWVVALIAATWMRFEFRWGPIDPVSLVVCILAAAVFHVALGQLIGLYRRRWRYGTFEEIAALAPVVVCTTAVVWAVNLLGFRRRLPVSSTILAGPLALSLSCGVRYVWRLVVEKRLRPHGENLQKTLVFGAGEGGFQAVDAMLRNPDSPYLPVAVLDDDPHKRGLHLRSIQVVGDRHAMKVVARRSGATLLVVAIPSASGALIRELASLASAAHLEMRVLPPVRDLLGPLVGVGDFRLPSDADLLGRRAIDTEVHTIAAYLAGRRVMVTGAGGSIGSELCRQVHQFGPATLVMLDRDESALQQVQLSIEGRALLDTRDLVVCDIRDQAALAAVFDEHRPEVVFHAAALKHLPLLEMWPDEAVKTNVWGTLNLLELSARFGVERFVNVSTDKAAAPCSVLGYTKRLAERLTAAAGVGSDAVYLSVRFGNVLGSRGSVLTAFHEQAASGGPLTVTHPDVTRFFMTIEEAVQLVIQAGALGRSGEALVLDMGEPVRIADLAQRLVEASDRPVSIEYTGLRPGEKLREVLFGPGEVDRRPNHPLISQVEVPGLAPRALDALRGGGHPVTGVLRALCGDEDPAGESSASVAVDGPGN